MRRRPNDVADGSALVGAEIVEHDDVARLQGFDELGFDIEAEGLAIDGSIEHPGRVNAIMPQRCDEGHRLPVAIRCVGYKPLAALAPATQRRHVGLDPGLVDEDQACWINAGLIAGPLRASARQLRPELLGRQNGFF